jgi:hypothetical protein
LWLSVTNRHIAPCLHVKAAWKAAHAKVPGVDRIHISSRACHAIDAF